MDVGFIHLLLVMFGGGKKTEKKKYSGYSYLRFRWPGDCSEEQLQAL